MLGLHLLTLVLQYPGQSIPCLWGHATPEHVHILLVMHVYKVVHSTNCSDDLIQSVPLCCQCFMHTKYIAYRLWML